MSDFVVSQDGHAVTFRQCYVCKMCGCVVAQVMERTHLEKCPRP